MAYVEDAGKPPTERTADRANRHPAARNLRPRRGVWTLAEKLRIVQDVRASDLPVSMFARSRGLTANNVYYWMRLAREGKLVNDPAQKRKAKTISPDELGGTIAGMTEDGQISSGTIEITFPNGAQIRIHPPIDYDLLSQVFAAAKNAVKQK